jgi:hypothetical protein
MTRLRPTISGGCRAVGVAFSDSSSWIHRRSFKECFLRSCNLPSATVGRPANSDTAVAVQRDNPDVSYTYIRHDSPLTQRWRSTPVRSAARRFPPSRTTSWTVLVVRQSRRRTRRTDTDGRLSLGFSTERLPLDVDEIPVEDVPPESDRRRQVGTVRDAGLDAVVIVPDLDVERDDEPVFGTD